MVSDESIVVVTAHYDENLSWLCACPYKVHLCDKLGARPIDPAIKSHFCCEPLIDNYGCEASSYLQYIIQHYHELPPYIAFIHGHEYAWHQQHPYGIIGAIRTAKKELYDYISLNVKTHPGGGRSYDLDLDDSEPMRLLKESWDDIFKPYVGFDLPRKFSHDSCAQFLVSRDAILRHPLEAYKKWFEFVCIPDTQVYENKNRAVVMEYIWHMVFGEAPICKERDTYYLWARFDLNRS